MQEGLYSGGVTILRRGGVEVAQGGAVVLVLRMGTTTRQVRLGIGGVEICATSNQTSGTDPRWIWLPIASLKREIASSNSSFCSKS